MSFIKYARNIQNTMIFFVKFSLYSTLFCSFFAIFSITNPQIVILSRTAGITMSTFIVLGVSMFKVYGGFSVGEKQSKEIISSLCIAIFITDLVTYLQLMIMNTNEYNQESFNLQYESILVLVILSHFAMISTSVYIGNYIFFHLNPPKRCLLISGTENCATELIKKIARYDNQFKIERACSPNCHDIYSHILDVEAVILYKVPTLYKEALLECAYKNGKQIINSTELSDVIMHNAKVTMLDDILMLTTTKIELSIEERIIKRIIDITVAVVGLIVLSPLMLVTALAINLYDGGDILYKQERLTINGKKFNVLKFRSMVSDAERESGAVLSRKNDTRVTPIGKFIRATRIDELPQFINVLVGDMSIVGPRPERESIAIEYYKEFPQFKYRLRAKAGLTGLAQISGKYNTSPKDKLILDLMYIEKYSVWADVSIIFQTLKVFFKSDSTEGV